MSYTNRQRNHMDEYESLPDKRGSYGLDKNQYVKPRREDWRNSYNDRDQYTHRGFPQQKYLDDPVTPTSSTSKTQSSKFKNLFDFDQVSHSPTETSVEFQTDRTLRDNQGYGDQGYEGRFKFKAGTNDDHKTLHDDHNIIHSGSDACNDGFRDKIRHQKSYTGDANSGLYNKFHAMFDLTHQSSTSDGFQAEPNSKDYGDQVRETARNYEGQFGEKIEHQTGYRNDFDKCLLDDRNTNLNLQSSTSSQFQAEDRTKDYRERLAEKMKLQTNYEDHSNENYSRWRHDDHDLTSQFQSSTSSWFETGQRSRNNENVDQFEENTKQQTVCKEDDENENYSKQIQDNRELIYQSQLNLSRLEAELKSRLMKLNSDDGYTEARTHQASYQENFKNENYSTNIHNNRDFINKSQSPTSGRIQTEFSSRDYNYGFGKRADLTQMSKDDNDTFDYNKQPSVARNSSYKRPIDDTPNTVESKKYQVKSGFRHGNKKQRTSHPSVLEGKRPLKMYGGKQKPFIRQNVSTRLDNEYLLSDVIAKKLFDGFVIVTFHDIFKSLGTNQKILQNSFHKNKLGPLHFVRGLGRRNKSIRFCMIAWNGNRLSKGIAEEEEDATEKACNQLLHRLKSNFYTLEINPGYGCLKGKTEIKYVPGLYRIPTPEEVERKGGVSNFIADFLKEDPDCDIWFYKYLGFHKATVNALKECAREQKLVFAGVHNQYSVVYKLRTPQYWRDKFLANEWNNANNKFMLIPPGADTNRLEPEKNTEKC